MKNPRPFDLRIAFDAAPALIALPPIRENDSPMSNASHEKPRPLGEISQEPSGFDQFMDRNQKNLMILAVVLVIGAASYIIYQGLKKSHEHSAGAALTKSEDLSSLQSVVKEYSKTAAGGSASVLLAEKQWSDGLQSDSIKTLQDFIANQPEHPALPTAQASLASKLASQGKADEASKLLEGIVSNESARFLAPYALLSLGDLAKNAGDSEKARKFYERAQNEFPGNDFASKATDHLAILDTKAPVEIAPPPAPAQPEGLPSIPGLAPTAPPVMAPESQPIPGTELPTLPTGEPSPAPPANESAPTPQPQVPEESAPNP